ncbi:hypothetical protein QR680_016252 [Steinernema hermaphroditum]|uniref:Serpentine receptor class gamma n=1 Tax=Steinernema hermaphroditum TaxID=289476 RepID=A0AA39LM93_9BILA|nr:hypothetical protein QR680_016252 [Steinernema hermaphroditum]
MDLFLFHHEEWQRKYNCSMRTNEEWYSYGQPNIPMGVYCIVVGCFFMTCSLPCVFVMIASKQLRIHSAYKMMAFLTTQQCCSLVINCFITGTMFIEGAVYCNHPYLLYFAGAAMFGLWEAQSLTCVLLAFSRLVDFWKISLIAKLFQGNRVLFWFPFPILLGLYYIFEPHPALFNSKALNWLSDPYRGMTGIPHDRTLYNGTKGIIANGTFMITTGVLNVLLIISIVWKSKDAQTSTLSKLQRCVTIQALVVCSLEFATSFTYEYMNFAKVTPALNLISIIVYQASCGIGGVIYLLFNKTIRAHLKKLLKKSNKTTAVYVVTAVNSFT